MPLRVGHHVSIAGSHDRAAEHAAQIGGNTLQIFSSSPRTWRGAPPSRAQAAAFRAARDRLGLEPLVIHGNYLINLASVDPVIRARSIEAYRGEVERALALEADYLVVHPGSHKDQPLEQAILAAAAGLAEAVRGLSSTRLTLLLENTAGQGSALGSRLEELSGILDHASGAVDFATGYCIDTAHSFAAGFAIHEEAGLEAFAAHVETVLGWARVPVIHCNDSKAAFASRVDRHQHIGEGYIGEKAFSRILQHPRLRGKAFILETPVEQDGDDARNISTIQRLCQKRLTTTAK